MSLNLGAPFRGGSASLKVVTLQALSALPLLAVALACHPMLAVIGFAASVACGTCFSVLGTSLPRQRLTDAVAAWQAGRDFTLSNADLPVEYRPLVYAIKRAMDQLGEREDELRKASEQQNLLMQEVHHRVKNNLQIVASLLNLQASRIKVPAAQQEFQSARDRVKALATLHRHLYAHGELHTINLREFLTELCGQLFSALGETPGVRIALRVDAPELEMSSDQAVPLALIVTETVSNSIKFAFPDSRAGTICVRLASVDSEAELTVADDGVGIDAAQTETGEKRRDGIGLQLIRGFARQLGGTLKVVDGTGTRYTVRMPLRRDRPVVSSKGLRPAA